MPLVPIRITPGVNTQATPTLLETGRASCQLIRFRDGLRQKTAADQNWVSLPAIVHHVAKTYRMASSPR